MHNDDRPFSRPFGYSAPEQEITIREDAPEALREARSSCWPAISD